MQYAWISPKYEGTCSRIIPVDRSLRSVKVIERWFLSSLHGVPILLGETAMNIVPMHCAVLAFAMTALETDKGHGWSGFVLYYFDNMTNRHGGSTSFKVSAKWKYELKIWFVINHEELWSIMKNFQAWKRRHACLRLSLQFANSNLLLCAKILLRPGLVAKRHMRDFLWKATFAWRMRFATCFSIYMVCTDSCFLIFLNIRCRGGSKTKDQFQVWRILSMWSKRLPCPATMRTCCQHPSYILWFAFSSLKVFRFCCVYFFLCCVKVAHGSPIYVARGFLPGFNSFDFGMDSDFIQISHCIQPTSQGILI